MTRATVGFLKQRLDTPGPSGFEQAPARLWRDEVATFADDVRADVHGNSVAAVNPKGKPRLMFAGHIDEIGVQITHIDEDGFLYFSGIGGWDSQVLVGQRVLLLGRAGPVHGVVGKKAIHHLKKEDLDRVTKVIDLWIDIGAANRDEAASRIRVGDAGVIDRRVEDYDNIRIVSRSLEHRIGAFVAAEALRRLASQRPKHAAVFAVASTREEIAWTGSGARTSAIGIEPDVALVIDVTHATDYPGADKKHSGDHKLGGGVVLTRGSSVSPLVFDLLVECAVQAKLPYTIRAARGEPGRDADAIYNAMGGLPPGLVGVPTRYMHTPNEMGGLQALDRGAELLAAFARRL